MFCLNEIKNHDNFEKLRHTMISLLAGLKQININYHKIKEKICIKLT